MSTERPVAARLRGEAARVSSDNPTLYGRLVAMAQEVDVMQRKHDAAIRAFIGLGTGAIAHEGGLLCPTNPTHATRNVDCQVCRALVSLGK